MRAVVVIFPGSNRERDFFALRSPSSPGTSRSRVWAPRHGMPESDLIVLPGGFAYGDYLRCGAMARNVAGRGSV